MPYPVDVYSVGSGQSIYGGRHSAPAWMVAAGAAVNKLVAIPNSSLSAATDTRVRNCGIYAYSGLTVKRDSSEIFSVACGGHSDSTDNGVYSFGPKGQGLLADSPQWIVRCTPTASPVGASDPPPATMYQADGKPTSRHAYDRNHYSAATGKIYLLGGTGLANTTGSPPDDRYTIHAYDPAMDAWDAPITTGFDGGTQGYGLAVDHLTGEIWTNGGVKYNPTTKTFSAGIKSGAVPSVGIRFPMVVAHNLGYAFCCMFGNGWSADSGAALTASKVDITTGAISSVTFNASAGYSAFIADASASGGLNILSLGMDYDEINGNFLWYRGTAGQENRIYRITPHGTAPWDVELITLATGSAGMTTQADIGPSGRVKYVPALKGFVFWPMGQKTSSPAYTDAPMYFLKTA